MADAKAMLDRIAATLGKFAKAQEDE